MLEERFNCIKAGNTVCATIKFVLTDSWTILANTVITCTIAYHLTLGYASSSATTIASTIRICWALTAGT
jgi:hypothetical protein